MEQDITIQIMGWIGIFVAIAGPLLVAYAMVKSKWGAKYEKGKAESD